MIKKIVIALLVSTFVLTGCNEQIIDTNYTFKRAYIEGVGEIEVSTWRDYDDGSDQIQITGKDGVTYLTHSSRVILFSK